MTEYRRRLEAGEYDPPGGHELRERTSEQHELRKADEGSLGSMTKGELIERAQSLGVSPANASMTKEDLVAAIEAAS